MALAMKHKFHREKNLCVVLLLQQVPAQALNKNQITIINATIIIIFEV
jgi:hypothetical protein